VEKMKMSRIDVSDPEDPSLGCFLTVLCQSHFEFYQHQDRLPDPHEAMQSLEKACLAFEGELVCFNMERFPDRPPNIPDDVRYAFEPHPRLGLGMMILIAFGDLENNSLEALLSRYSVDGPFGTNWLAAYRKEVLVKFLERFSLSLGRPEG
jgi:hypothetical protein